MAYVQQQKLQLSPNQNIFLDICSRMPLPSVKLKYHDTYLEVYTNAVNPEYDTYNLNMFIKLFLEIVEHPAKWVLYMKEPCFKPFPRTHFVWDYLNYRESLK